MEKIEYTFTFQIKNINHKISPILFSEGNIVYFNKFKIDFSSEKYEKINIKKIYEYNKTRIPDFGIISESDTLVFASNVVIEKSFFNNNIHCPIDEKIGYELLIISKKYLEVIEKIEMTSTLHNLLPIDNNLFLFNKIKKIFLAEFNIEFKIIDSKEFNIEDKLNESYSSHGIKYNNNIFYLYSFHKY